MNKIFDYFHRLGVDKNTTATIFITILVFGLGLFFTWMGSQIKKFSERRRYKKSIIYVLEEFSRACKRQTVVVKKTLDKAGLVDGNDFNIDFVPIGTLDYLNKVDLSIMVQNLGRPIVIRLLTCKGSNLKAVSKLIEIVTLIKATNEQVATITKMYFKSYEFHEKQFYSCVDDLRKLNDLFALQAPKGEILPMEIPYVKSYFDIFNKWFEAGASTIIKVEYEAIVLKVLELNKKFNNVSYTLQTNNLALLASNSYSTIEKVDKLLFEHFTHFIHVHKRAGKIVDVIIKMLE
jgi:hypothetical protein